MAQIVIDIYKSELSGVLANFISSLENLRIKAPSRTIIMLGVVLGALQIIDGILTAIGINQFGVSAEGNMVIRALIESFGPIAALFISKMFALMVITALCFLSSKVNWIDKAFTGVIAIYTVFAIVPWTYILFFQTW